MRKFIAAVLILVLFNSCKKKATYKSLSGTELDFVNYSPGQNLKFSDTNTIVQSFLHDTLIRVYQEFTGLYGNTYDFNENFEAGYYSAIDHSLRLDINLTGKFLPYTPGILNMNICGYAVYQVIDSLPPAIPSLTINSISYSDVHSLKAYKNAVFVNNTDTATLYCNRQYGVIQLLLPNGKAITRMD